MHGEENTAEISTGELLKRLSIMITVSLAVGFGGYYSILSGLQAVSCAVFISIIMGTLFFWNFRLAIAFIGLAVLIFTSSIDIEGFVHSAELPVILFLVGMMIIVGALRDLGFFTWIVQLIVSMPNISGAKFIAVTATASALLACAVDEVTSIIFISTLIFQACDRLKLNPAPYIIICVLCTNVGSAGTMMGNPVGILIGKKAQLSFMDFMIWSFPIMLIALALTVALTMFYYRKDLKQFEIRLKERMSRDLSLVPQVDVPYAKGLFLLIVTIVFIASHHALESLLGLAPNSILLVAPLICSGFVMIFKRNRARHYVEKEVDWWTLLFFMLLFAVAGALKYTDVTGVMAGHFVEICGSSVEVLVPVIIAISSVGSAFVDNVIFVAAFCPVIESLGEQSVHTFPLWWALLFGACFGGNITMIGSTANIVALGMLEKRSNIHIKFWQWIKIGFFSALIACIIGAVGILILHPYMPHRNNSHNNKNQITEIQMKGH